jgi:hypothetical protein
MGVGKPAQAYALPARLSMPRRRIAQVGREGKGGEPAGCRIALRDGLRQTQSG